MSVISSEARHIGRAPLIEIVHRDCYIDSSHPRKGDAYQHDDTGVATRKSAKCGDHHPDEGRNRSHDKGRNVARANRCCLYRCRRTQIRPRMRPGHSM